MSPFQSIHFGGGESVRITTIWITGICFAFVIKLAIRHFENGFEIVWLDRIAKTLFWIAFPIATVALIGGHILFYMKLNLGTFIYSAIAIQVGMLAGLIVSIAGALHLNASNRLSTVICMLSLVVTFGSIATILIWGFPFDEKA